MRSPAGTIWQFCFPSATRPPSAKHWFTGLGIVVSLMCLSAQNGAFDVLEISDCLGGCAALGAAPSSNCVALEKKWRVMRENFCFEISILVVLFGLMLGNACDGLQSNTLLDGLRSSASK